jgi:hypothetical protein
MAVTTENSIEYGRSLSSATVKNEAGQDGGRLTIKRFTFTQGAAAGDAESFQNLVKIPPGVWYMLCPLSFIQWDAFGAARVLDIGWTAYVTPDGTAVAADEDGIETVIDVSAAGQQSGLGDGVAVGVGRCIRFASRDGVTIQANNEGGTIPAGTKLSGYFILAGGG